MKRGALLLALVACAGAPPPREASPEPLPQARAEARAAASATAAPASSATEPDETADATGGDVIRAVPPAVPSLRAQTVTLSNSYPIELVRAMVHRHLAALRACYVHGLARTPGLRGRVVVHFTIQPSGAVAGARAGSSSLPDASVVDCVVRTVGAIPFPQPPGELHVTYPFVFQPS
jgi:TonB family protein